MSDKIKFHNYSMLAGKKYNDDWWRWCIFVDEKEQVVKKIKQVEYTLHPTFPDPIRTVDDRSERFALYSSGWGQFTAFIEIIFNDNTTKNQSYFVKFIDGNWPIKKEPLEFKTPEERAVYNAIKHEKHNWRKTNTLVKATSLSIEKVIETLTVLEGKKLVRKNPFKALDKSDLWGITAIVGCSPPKI